MAGDGDAGRDRPGGGPRAMPATGTGRDLQWLRRTAAGWSALIAECVEQPGPRGGGRQHPLAFADGADPFRPVQGSEPRRLRQDRDLPFLDLHPILTAA